MTFSAFLHPPPTLDQAFSGLSITNQSFHKFQDLPAEIRIKIWKDAVHEEAAARLIFLNHSCSFRILPTKNNISPLLSVNVEAREVALKHYNIRLPLFELTSSPKPENLMTFEKWIATTPDISWRKLSSADGKSLTDREKYWYIYVLNKSARAANMALMKHLDSQRGCMFFNATTDRFLLLPHIRRRDIVEETKSDTDLFTMITDYMNPISYQMTFGHKAEILGKDSLQASEIIRRHISTILPVKVLDHIQNVVAADPFDQIRYVTGSSNHTSRYLLQEPGIDQIRYFWRTGSFPTLLDASGNRTARPVLYLELPSSESCTLVGEVENRTARDLNIIEIDENGLGWDKFIQKKRSRVRT